MKPICGHDEWNYGHCAHMGCPYYVSVCPQHALSGNGDTCNLIREARWEWLVEEATFATGLAFEVITFHLIVVAKDHELAFNLANRAAEEHTGGKRFLCEPQDLREVDPGYLWHFGEAPAGYEVRKLRQVPIWTKPGPVPFQCPNVPADPRTEVKDDAAGT